MTIARLLKDNTKTHHTPPLSQQLLGDIRSLIASARAKAASSINTALVLLHWHIGERIHRDILGLERAEYGRQIIATLSETLTTEYGKGFTRTALFRMVQCAETFPDQTIVATLSQQLGWSHFVELVALDKPLQREFYAEMCRIERWSVRTLRTKIQGMLYERTTISKKPRALAQQELANLRNEDRMSPDLVFRDPYVLDFLELGDTYGEKDLEEAILKELERFLLELGTDFSFVARQKRLSIGKEDFYIDLLFYHRRLSRLVAIELKMGRFTAAAKGQMELYLRWLDKYERRQGEAPPIGLILCSEKDHDQIELLELDKGTIRVAEYLTELPPRPLLEAKLDEAIHRAQAQITTRHAPTEMADNEEEK